ncbi:hypothetical protein EJ08DRAFT_702143 [Tothia fuscella]|uniref:Uncharacterized protein n=1 Tax=Tothia fuscella TaxID=1048955 RepID=A0A9P4NH40_9PEZI|nr:hypothetical protein EJ08DRAFT_702143 [Tothia fuscella]
MVSFSKAVPFVSTVDYSEEEEDESQNLHRSEFHHARDALCSIFLSLALPTIVAVAVLVADVRSLKFTTIHAVVTDNRASISVAVQIVSVILGLLQIEAVDQLFSLATQSHLTKVPTSLGALQFWNGIRSRTMNWNLKPKLFVLLCVYLLLAAIPATIWTGALTPVVTSKNVTSTTRIPQYVNMSLLKEYPSEIGKSGPSLRNDKGFFTYSVGVQYAELLTQTLSTAISDEGSPRHHIKYDNSEFLYIGRSYGLGSSVGLIDDAFLGNSLAKSYQYQERGYESQVSCSYNTSVPFFQIYPNSVEDMLYAAKGYLPDSIKPEYSLYVGHSTDAIVAFGVTAQPIEPTSLTRYFGIGAGKSYQTLNSIQCKVDFLPSTFDVSVNILGRNITVSKASTASDGSAPIPDLNIDQSGKLSHVAMRQIELYSNDLTSIYQSLVGNALNFSISDLQTQKLVNQSVADSNLKETTLAAVEISFAAMLDDIMVGYASAQLMIAKDSTDVPAIITTSAIRFGKSIYIYLIIGINAFVMLLMLEEAIRTRGWRDSSQFDYADFAQLAFASSRGGTELAESMEAIVAEAEREKHSKSKGARIARLLVPWSSYDPQLKVLVRDNGKEQSKDGLGRFTLGIA